jgi:alpha-ribazole phosphatase/probable phosphoglycerate mutase
MEGKPTRLFLVRHGEVNAQDRKNLYGAADVKLSDVGIAQSRLTGLALRRFPIRAVYTSDLSRARTVGEQIALQHGLRPVVTPLLRERHFGHWQGLPWEEIQARFPEEFAAFEAQRFYYRVPGGAENFQDVQARVIPCLREIILRHPGETVAITAHSGPTRLILAHAFQMPLECIFTFEQDYCCLNAIDAYPSGRMRVKTLNSIEHLLELEVEGES